jgi:glycosyltransferase involved in cell wall biosynthesis
VRIALVVQGGLDRSGQTRVVPAMIWLVERLARRHEVHAFALRHDSRPSVYRLAGATVHDLGGFRDRWGPGVVRVLPALLRELRRAGPFDVVHGHLAAAPGALAVIAGRLLAVPVVVSLANGELTALPDIGYGLQVGWRGRVLASLALRGAERLTAPSHFVATLARDRGFTVDVLPRGVDTTVFSPGTPRGGPPWRLVQVASLSRVKDQLTLLAAMRHLADREADVSLDLVGEDTLGGATQQQCTRLGLDRRVRFHGFRTSDQVRDILRSAHLYVQSSRYEAAGVAVLEAAACAVPTVGTSVGYVADWAPECASSVAVGDAAGLAAAIAGLLNEEGRRAEMGQRAREWVLARDADWVAARWEELYGQLQGRHAIRHI